MGDCLGVRLKGGEEEGSNGGVFETLCAEGRTEVGAFGRGAGGGGGGGAFGGREVVRTVGGKDGDEFAGEERGLPGDGVRRREVEDVEIDERLWGWGQALDGKGKQAADHMLCESERLALFKSACRGTRLTLHVT